MQKSPFTARVEYQGNLRTSAVHLKSNTRIITDAPTDNEGKGEAFSPTDLVATALASCMLTLMGIAAHAHSINLGKIAINVRKMMESN
jgi:putative redox protein